MKLIVLAAGFATRLYPLTQNTPKPLLGVAGRPMIDHVLDRLCGIRAIDRVYVVVNGKFERQFQEWAGTYRFPHREVPIEIVSDGSTDDSNKLGAIGDFHFVLTNRNVADDVVMVAGDNLFSENLDGFGEFVEARRAPVLGVYDVGNLEEIRKYNAISTDDEGRIKFFEEKPKNPTSTITGIALYYYPANTLPLVLEYVREGNNTDQPGRLVQWMYPRLDFYTWRVPGIWYDIGSVETLREANRVFAESPVPAKD